MVLASEVNPVNQLYRQLSSRYKSAWTFHRFIQGLRKFFGSQDLDDRTSDFQKLYQRLRGLSTRLDDIDIAPVVEGLEDTRRVLDELVVSLDEQDRKISPSLVRLFFQRVKSQDERILIDLIRFYVEAQRGRSWEEERFDKTDFLLSRLGEQILNSEAGGDPERLKRVLRGISEHVEVAPVDPQKIANRMKLIQAVSREIQQVESFEDLTERDLVAHYRNVKHGLGALAFEKSILPMLVETNLTVSERVTELTEIAQARIFADYEKVQELEERGLLARDLAESVSKLHHQVGTFRREVQKGTLRLDAMAEIQEAVRDIFRRIELDETADLEDELGREETLAIENLLPTRAERDLLGQLFEDLIAALRETRRSVDKPSELDPRLLKFRLGAREIEAFARLASGADCDAALEQFLLTAAVLRRQIKLFVDDLHNVGKEATPGSRSAALEGSAVALRLGDQYLRRFGHFLEMRLVDQEAPRVRQLQIAKMHLMREYSGLWLLVNESIRDHQS
ncbi:MAG: hypothetical protein ACE5GX_03980 [Thermoanaerobaculia bacterium]